MAITSEEIDITSEVIAISSEVMPINSENFGRNALFFRILSFDRKEIYKYISIKGNIILEVRARVYTREKIFFFLSLR